MIPHVSAWVVPKQEPCEDRWDYSSDNFRIALCDGASESFDSSTWAGILVKRYLEDNNVTAEWLNAAIHEYHEKWGDISKLSWSQQLALERGSFATFMGLTFDREKNVCDLCGIGDSVALAIRENAVVRSFPVDINVYAFSQKPTLFSTCSAYNENVFDEEAFFKEQWTIDDSGMTSIILATDALAEYIHSNIDNGIIERLSKMDEKDFIALIEQERAERKIRIDDTTFVKILFRREV